MLKTLGGKKADYVKECTHLITEKVTRTAKFLSAVSLCPFILHLSWIEQSYQQHQWLDEKKFILRDEEAEEKYQFSLVESLRRARLHPLLSGMRFYATPHIVPNIETLRLLIECAAGQLLIRAPLREGQLTQTDVIVLASEEDRKMCEPFWEAYPDVRIYTAEFLLTGLLKQHLEFHL
jgi:hypothetical protein